MPFATINGIKIHYLVQGSGPPLLMFAPGGWRSVISRWTAAGGKEAFGQMDGLAALSRHFTCIAYDRRECGLSGGRVEPLNWNLYAAEARALLDLAAVKDATILGSCMGASLALAFAVRHPEACKGLILHWPVCAHSRDAIFNDTMPSGASGEELMRIRIPALIMSGADTRHTRSAAWTLKELMPQSELWDVMPPDQNGQNTLERILLFKSRFEATAQAA